MIWNVKIREADQDGKIFRLVDEFLSHTLTLAARSDQQKTLIEIAKRMTDQPKRVRMLAMAQSNVLLKSVPEDYDQEPSCSTVITA